MVKLLNTMKYPPFKKSHIESLQCERASNAYEWLSLQDIQGICLMDWAGLTSLLRNGIPLLLQESWPTLAGEGWLSEGAHGPKFVGASIYI